MIKRLVGWLACRRGEHDPEYLSVRPGYMGGIYAPFRCKRCGHVDEGSSRLKPGIVDGAIESVSGRENEDGNFVYTIRFRRPGP